MEPMIFLTSADNVDRIGSNRSGFELEIIMFVVLCL